MLSAEQLFGRTAHESAPYKLLLASIIRRAAFDIALYTSDPRPNLRRHAVGAYVWMFNPPNSDDGLDRFMSFENICQILDQDPNVIREKTKMLKRSDVKKADRVRI
jgi:hypothetical protein